MCANFGTYLLTYLLYGMFTNDVMNNNNTVVQYYYYYQQNRITEIINRISFVSYNSYRRLQTHET